ncbi:MAG: Bug family tripartite tricarboxylate transporter substrate binding protein [Rhizobacter sp.]|jgi:tripartite-type tricarboxylate transporter receptor subunit TctC
MLKSFFSHSRRLTLLSIAALCAHAGAQGQTYPSKPITFIVPFAAGSATDQLARALGQSITEQTRQTVIVENKAGAGGMLAAQAVARAPADGYTVLIATNTTQAANEHLYKKMPYDPVKDFAPVTGLGKGGQVMVVPASSPYRTVADVVSAARKAPGKLSFGSGSSSSRMAGEMLKQLAGIDVLHVPYKSNPMALTDLIGGQFDFMITDTSTGVPHIKSGRLRPLAYSTRKRSTQLPDVPTLEEAGIKGYDISYWFATYVPAGTPTGTVNALRQLIVQGVNGPATRAFFETSGSEPWTTAPEELAAFQASETVKWGKVIRAAGIEPE